MNIYKLIVAILIGLMLIKCNTKKNYYSEIPNEDIDKTKSDSLDNEYDKYYSNGFFSLRCGNKKLKLKSSNFNRHDFLVSGISKCLYKNGFNGDRNANLQIATLISVVGYKFRYAFPESQYRGPQIFEALMKKAGEFDKTGTYIRLMYSMIKRIDGFSSNRLDLYVYEANGLDSMVVVTGLGFGEDVEHNKLTYRTLKKAWEEGKIELKAFGEK